MGQITLKEVLETYRDIDLLEDEHGELWTVRNLIGAFVEGKRTWPEDAPPGFTLDSLIYIEGENIHPVSAEGSISQTPVFRKITPPKNPYRVISVDNGYRVVFMENEGQWKYHLINGQPFYQHKQAANRRKDRLNQYWQEHDVLWKWKSRGNPGKNDYQDRP